jgi:hypothetical protein
MSVPAETAVFTAICVIVTSLEAVQPLEVLVTVHLKTVLTELLTPVRNFKVEVGDVGVFIVNPLPPDTIDHTPVSPDCKGEADKGPTEVPVHIVIGLPAFAVGKSCVLIVTSLCVGVPSPQIVDILN